MSHEQFAAYLVKACIGIFALMAGYTVMVLALWIMGKVTRQKPRRHFKIPREYLK